MRACVRNSTRGSARGGYRAPPQREKIIIKLSLRLIKFNISRFKQKIIPRLALLRTSGGRRFATCVWSCHGILGVGCFGGNFSTSCNGECFSIGPKREMARHLSKSLVESGGWYHLTVHGEPCDGVVRYSTRRTYLLNPRCHTRNSFQSRKLRFSGLGFFSRQIFFGLQIMAHLINLESR